MSDIVAIVWVTVIAIAFFGGIPYGVWFVYTLIKKRWKLAGLQLGIPILALLLLLLFSWIVDSIACKRYLKNIFDTDVALGSPIFNYDSARAFNGDGYSIAVYKLPPEIRRRFESANAQLLSEFPKLPSYRSHWELERWHPAPFDDKFKDYLNFALNTPWRKSDANRLSKHFTSIRKALSKKGGAYYAFFYYSHGDYPGDIDLFIVDLEGDRLYIINHNT